MRTAPGIAAGILAGLIAGWSLARMSEETAREDPAPDVERAPETARPEEPAELEAPPAAVEREALPEVEEPDGGDPALIHAGLERYAREGIARGWLERRRNPIPEPTLEKGLRSFERTVLDAPAEIGRELGQREDERDEVVEDFQAGDPLALLAELAEGGIGPRPELVSDGEGFARLFPAHPGGVVDGLAAREHPDLALEDGATLRFPSGVFRLERLMEEKDPFPSSVTVQGAGMDATLLLVKEFSTRGKLASFTLRDCTVHVTYQYLFDLRNEPSSIVFDRVRITGFDSGAGGSCMLSSRGTALLARGSRIEGGYGRSPRHGTLFDVRNDALLARFEGCRIDLVALDLWRLRPGASIAFVRCTLTDILDPKPVEEVEHPGVVLLGTTIGYYRHDQGEPQRKDLNELFPGWEQRIDR